MLDPEAVVEQVWQRIVPADWKIIRGKRRSSFSIGVSAAIWAGAASFFLAILAALLNNFFATPAAGGSTARLLAAAQALLFASLTGYPALAVSAAAALALALLVGIGVWIGLARRHAGDPDPVIVLLPEGFVEFVSHHQPIIGAAYADLASVDFGTRSGRRFGQRQPPSSQEQMPRQKHLWLDLRFYDNSQDRWQTRANFGPPARIYQTIIKAHSLYHILYEGRY